MAVVEGSDYENGFETDATAQYEKSGGAAGLRESDGLSGSEFLTSESQERPGLRVRRRQLRRERRMKIGAAGITAGVAGAVLVVGLVAYFVGSSVLPDGAGSGGSVPGKTLLVIHTDEANPDSGAVGLTLFGISDDSRTASVLLIPPGVSSEIPTRGPDRLGEAITFGEPALTRMTVENLLGIRVDSFLVMNNDGYKKLFEPISPVPITIPERLTAKTGDVYTTRFSPGSYEFTPEVLLEYMNFQGENESELQRLTRHQRVWEAVFAKSGGDTSPMFRHLGGPLGTDSTTGNLVEFFNVLARAERGYSLLPVDPKNPLEGEERYEPRVDEIESMANKLFPGSRPASSRLERVRVGILNGNGQVDITEDVAQKLIRSGYLVVLTENADNFDYERTQIAFYRTPFQDDARRIQEEIGTGQLVYNRNPQDVVDVLIVIGHDYRPSGR